jgi:hypothetical protein
VCSRRGLRKQEKDKNREVQEENSGLGRVKWKGRRNQERKE